MKMSIHRALAELKLLEKRISRATNAKFIATSQGGKAPRGFSNTEQFNEDAKNSYKSVTSLMERRNAIKAAIIKSNAVKTVKIGGKTYTIAEAIDQKGFIDYKIVLLNTMKDQHRVEMNLVNKEETRVQNELNAHLVSTFGAKEVNPDNLKEAQKAVADAFMERNSTTLLDPLELSVKIKELEEEIETFQNEIDYSLSESNASTEIEVPDTV